MNTDETVTLAHVYFIFFSIFVSIFLTNKIVQDWIKKIYLESRAEIKLIVIFFCSESMTFVFSHSSYIAR